MRYDEGMAARETHLELRCPDCGWRDPCDIAGMRAWLHSVGMLRRATDSPPDLIVELFRNSRERFACPECDAVPLIEQPGEADWPASRTCEVCGEPIPSARLTALPSATTCAACQERIDRGEPVGEVEYCPRCGGMLVMRQAGGGGARYVMRCSDCGR